MAFPHSLEVQNQPKNAQNGVFTHHFEGYNFNRPVWKHARSMQLAEIKRMNELSFRKEVYTKTSFFAI